MRPLNPRGRNLSVTPDLSVTPGPSSVDGDLGSLRELGEGESPVNKDANQKVSINKR